MIWVIPMSHVLHDLLPTETLCRKFAFRPVSLVECLVLEWFRYQSKSGIYGLDHVFQITPRTMIESVIPEFISLEDRLVMRQDAEDAERLIAAAGYQIMDTLHSYADTMDAHHLITDPANILQWAGDTIIVRLP